MSAVERRRELRERAKRRQAETLPKLRAALQAARAHKRARLVECREHCHARRLAIRDDARRARAELSARIKAARDAARNACKVCKVTARDEGLQAIDDALAAVQHEREQIAELRRRAARLKSKRGSAGGRRSAELRAESDDAVRRDLDDDPILLAVWERQKGRVRATPHMSRTEAFLELLHREPELLDEERSRLEAQWEREAEAAYKGLAKRQPRSTDAELDKWARELDEADRLLAHDAAPAPF